VDDQLAVIEQLAEQPYVDEGHIGIWGWSFGGYMTCRTLTRGSANVKTGMAVAPVTDWRFYDSVYTEVRACVLSSFLVKCKRHVLVSHVLALHPFVCMCPPALHAHSASKRPRVQCQVSGTACLALRVTATLQVTLSVCVPWNSSVVKFAHGIPDNQLLLVHGTGDDNVHYLNSMELVKQLVAAQVLFDFMAYPNQQHGISNSGAQDHIWRILSRHVDSHLSTSPDQLAGSYRL